MCSAEYSRSGTDSSLTIMNLLDCAMEDRRAEESKMVESDRSMQLCRDRSCSPEDGYLKKERKGKLRQEAFSTDRQTFEWTYLPFIYVALVDQSGRETVNRVFA